MPELLFPQTPVKTQDVCNADPDTLEEFLRCNLHITAKKGTLPGRFAYNMSLDSTPSARLILQRVNGLPAHSRDQLSACVADYGQDTVALARFYERHLADLHLPDLARDTNGIAGVGTAVMSGRTSAFKVALERYQRTLVELNNYTRVGRAAAGRRLELRNQVQKAYKTLNAHYQLEMQRIVAAQNFNKNRGSALSGPNRGITLAERYRGRGIHVADLHEGQSVSRFADSLRYVGRGLVAIDIGFRAERIRSSHQNNENWRREIAVQTGGLAGASGGGFTAGRIAMLSRAALAATPMGWAVLIGSTVAIGAVLAYQGDKAGQGFFGNLWDRVF